MLAAEGACACAMGAGSGPLLGLWMNVTLGVGAPGTRVMWTAGGNAFVSLCGLLAVWASYDAKACLTSVACKRGQQHELYCPTLGACIAVRCSMQGFWEPMAEVRLFASQCMS